MTQEEKQLVLRDLCARLPYKPSGRYSLACDSHSFIHFDCLTLNIVDRFANSQKSYWDEIGAIQLYLRPMSSMTEEEKKEASILLNYEFYIDDDCALVAEDDRHRIRLDLMQVYIDWLNSHHFDFRNLIERGLALEVTKDNNPYEA